MTGVRVVGALLIAALGVVSLDVPRAGAARTVELNARASISSAVLDAQPSFDPALLDARAAASSVGTSSLSSVVWPSFLVDAFFFLYGFQAVERIALGISQAGWPQGPETARATQSESFASNLDGVVERPVRGGVSESSASADRARALASAAGGALPGGLSISTARSSATVDRTPGVDLARAEMHIGEIVAGPLTLRGLSARAEATPSSERAELTIGAAAVAGVAVTLDGDTLRAPTRAAQALVDDALAASGIRVEVLPSSGATVRGVSLSVPFRATDPTGESRDIRIAYVFGDVSADARAREIEGAAPPAAAAPSQPARTAPHDAQPHLALTSSDVPAPIVDAPATRVVRRVVRTADVPAAPASARGAYAAFLALAIALLSFRPLVRQAARP